MSPQTVASNFVIASRRSPLAQAQAFMVRDLLAAAAEVDIDAAEDLFPVKTFVSSGDRNLSGSLAEIGGKGLFTKEIEEALLNGTARFAVHSMKDMPAVSPPGLVFAGSPPREDPRDVFISFRAESPWSLPFGARLGVSSVRRAAQTLARRPDLELAPLRGNVGTRLQKLKDGEADATFLAMAGLKRLGMEEIATAVLEPEEMLPAVGQGALFIQARADDEEALALAAKVSCPETFVCTTAERAFLAGLDGSCRTPIAGLAVIDGDDVWLRGELLTLDGSKRFAVERRFACATGGEKEAARIGADAAREIRAKAGPDHFASIASP
ncbi:MAG: hydroxymethylbilane synthase [Parvularculaceae bacterium]